MRLLPGVAMWALALPLAHAGAPEARVIQVWPSAAEVPANLLRLSIEFAAPVEGPVLPRIGLAHPDGTLLQQPFLPQELWSPDGRILTLLFHPGRVKTGLVARERLGPVLSTGDDVLLTLDEHPVRRWHVGSTDANGPMVSAWRLSPVRVATRQPLVVALDAPIDGRDTDYVAVVAADDRIVDGHAALKDGETTWTFVPDAPWQAGTYRLAVRGTLEDPAGNRPGRHFETAMDSPPKPAMDAVVVFHIGPSLSPEAGAPPQTAR
jgi:hypothetical protein